MAVYLGGMGSAKTKVCNRLAHQLGFATAAAEVQRAFLDGRIDAAIAALPDNSPLPVGNWKRFPLYKGKRSSYRSVAGHAVE